MRLSPNSTMRPAGTLTVSSPGMSGIELIATVGASLAGTVVDANGGTPLIGEPVFAFFLARTCRVVNAVACTRIEEYVQRMTSRLRPVRNRVFESATAAAAPNLPR